MADVAVDYYTKKYGVDLKGVFIHVVREVGELARAMERDQKELAVHEITEIAALMKYLAYQYGADLEKEIDTLYSKKLQQLG